MSHWSFICSVKKYLVEELLVLPLEHFLFCCFFVAQYNKVFLWVPLKVDISKSIFTLMFLFLNFHLKHLFQRPFSISLAQDVAKHGNIIDKIFVLLYFTMSTNGFIPADNQRGYVFQNVIWRFTNFKFSGGLWLSASLQHAACS